VSESSSPLSSKILVDETLPMMLKVGIKLNSDLNHIGHSAWLHLSKLKAVVFRRTFSAGLSFINVYLSIFM
jgi:hypothetical protein